MECNTFVQGHTCDRDTRLQVRSGLSWTASNGRRQAGTSANWTADKCEVDALGNWGGIENLRAALSIAFQANDHLPQDQAADASGCIYPSLNVIKKYQSRR